MIDPTSVIAQAIRISDGHHNLSAHDLALVVVEAVTGPEIVANAVNALLSDGWRETPDDGFLDDEDLRNIASTVLSSLRGPVEKPED